ncbi:MAG: hypothetical protein HQK89_15345 [Nitrospirae bacterium]|nr:hypothetical protein [Nitrospirota bacterium]
MMISLWRKGRSKTPEMDECKARLKIVCNYHKNDDSKQVRNLCNLMLDGWEAVVYFTQSRADRADQQYRREVFKYVGDFKKD